MQQREFKVPVVLRALRLRIDTLIVLIAAVATATTADISAADVPATVTTASQPASSQPAASQPTSSEVPAAAESVAAADTTAPLPSPKYNNLRYDDDFSYLDGPKGSYRKDFFDPIKNIHLDENWLMSLGGEIRVRVESETNRSFGSVADPTQDTFFLHREIFHLDLKYKKTARFFAQVINAQDDDRDLARRNIDENRWDVQQLFADVRPFGDDTPLTVRVGRQELQYGKQRLISPLDWANTRRRFDGVKVMYKSEKFDIDAFYTRPVPLDLSDGMNRKPDEYREEEHFWGIYSTYKGIERHYVDVYYLGYVDDGNRTNANGNVGDLMLTTIGSRIGGKTGGWDYDLESAGQLGSFAGQELHAWMIASEVGYTFGELGWKPRLAAGVDWGTGDRTPNDRAHETFNHLFPLGHAHWGYLDLFGLQNLFATNLNLTAKPTDKLTTRIAWYTFWADSDQDALYNTGGAPVRRDPLGQSGRSFGNEVDVTLAYEIDVHQSLLLGWSHFWPDNFIRNTGPSQDADLLYLQYAIKF